MRVYVYVCTYMFSMGTYSFIWTSLGIMLGVCVSSFVREYMFACRCISKRMHGIVSFVVSHTQRREYGYEKLHVHVYMYKYMIYMIYIYKHLHIHTFITLIKGGKGLLELGLTRHCRGSCFVTTKFSHQPATDLKAEASFLSHKTHS